MNQLLHRNTLDLLNFKTHALIGIHILVHRALVHLSFKMSPIRREKLFLKNCNTILLTEKTASMTNYTNIFVDESIV